MKTVHVLLTAGLIAGAASIGAPPAIAAARSAVTVSISAIDLRTGAETSLDGSRRIVTASIVKVDILAALLLREHSLTADDKQLATRMIEHSDNNAASALWDRIGEGPGLNKANERLGLRRTTPGAAGYWGLTRTTADDQVLLLRALTGAPSPLRPSARRYILGLMSHVEADQAWGVSAAAKPGDDVALKNGWLPLKGAGGTWVVNSIGRIRHHGRRMLLAVLTQGNATEGSGIAQTQRIARAVSAALNRLDRSDPE